MSIADRVTRRTFLQASAVSAAAAAATTAFVSPAAEALPPKALPSKTPAPSSAGPLFDELDEKIQSGMTKYAIPGAAVGVLHQGVEYVKGYGVTNVDYPAPVDGDTVFRIGSTTKTFTGTTVMRLVEQGKLALDAPVHRYLSDFHTSDPPVASRVTVRQLLNHTAGWLGDYYEDTGQGDDAATRYATGIARLPQLNPPGAVFAYNNAAVELAGRLIEVVTGKPYEVAVRELLINPLGLAHTRFFVDEIVGLNVAASHNVRDGKPVVDPSFYRLWRSLHAAGGLISSVRDQLRYARFHLGNGTVPGGGARLLSQQSLVAMRSEPGPGGTLFVELDGVGVSWMLRPSAEGIRIVQHGGDWPGQHSGMLMVPDRGFVFTMLTNSESGPALLGELFADDWALRRFAGVSNLPASPLVLTSAELAPYEGRYAQQTVDPAGTTQTEEFELTANNGQLVAAQNSTPQARLAFYRPDYVLVLGLNGDSTHTRGNFVRDAQGQVQWLRLGGRLSRHQPPGTPSSLSTSTSTSRSAFATHRL